MIKKLPAFMLLFPLLLALVGCAGSDEQEESDSVLSETDTSEAVAEGDREEKSEEVSTEDASSGAEEGEDDYGISLLPLYIRLSVESLDDGVATVLIENRSGYEITYDDDFSLEKEEAVDQWVTLKPTEEIVFEDTEYLLEDLEDAEVSCDLNPYGELKDGNYRIEKDDLYAAFSLEDGELLLPESPYD